jgi:hypothetical protein
METLDDNPSKITATHRARNRSVSTTLPELWISPYAYESFLMVDAACDRWLKRRAALRRRASEHTLHQLPTVPALGDDCHSDHRGE